LVNGPDVLVATLPAELIGQVTHRWPGAAIVILSRNDSDPYVLDALRNGVAGYVLDQEEPEELLQALREVAAGGRYLSSSLSQRAFEVYARGAEESPPDPFDRLTVREREVLGLMAEGHSGVQIAGLLCLSPRTVESHRQKLMNKLGLHTLAEVVTYAIHRGLLQIS